MDDAPLSGQSFIRQGITYVPLVALLDALGAGTATWDDQHYTAQAQTPHFFLKVPIDRQYVLADGYSYLISSPSLIQDGRTYVPLRSVASLLGADVTFNGWDNPIAVTSREMRRHTEEDLYWLSRVISAESQGENLLGQIAVGNVVLNRLDSDIFPNTIKEVIFDRKDAVQFEPTSNGTIYLPPTEQSILAAKLVLAGATAVDDCLYFFNPSLSQGLWIRQNCHYYTTIGCHQFYRS